MLSVKIAEPEQVIERSTKQRESTGSLSKQEILFVSQPSPRSIVRKPDPAEEGQSLIEFALALPVMLLVVTAIFAFGLALNNYLVMSDATAVSSRTLAISRGNTTDPCATTANAFYAAAPNLKKTSLTFSFVLNGTSYSGTSCSSGSTTTGAAGNLQQGASAQVIVSYPCTLAVYGTNYAPTCNMKAQTTELVQ